MQNDKLTTTAKEAMNPLAWKFMNEPLWRWFVFFLAMNLMVVAWNGVLRNMR